jgi:Domain of unknown function (DUF4133)
MATVYDINKGINRSIEFKGVKAQYITYLAIGLVLVLVLFAIMYACGTNIYICLGIIIPCALALIGYVQHMSKTYGEHGLVKRMAGRRLPSSLQCRSRKVFTSLKSSTNASEKAI